ncbi:hypothetical protein BC936DRAFT_140156 [Jimgerdemannia flammicorona]|uniref:Uncharacterized protein n=2 Tax=Jimgerdemannia flammicorona TaxID=994334 RepID=A0A433Q7T4_9FUNG|nr:hypothetical protein BC936DRAFT_140156 [Jimgerdemannia flammicorona]RUS25833.1 hypothetical protein BC938DRAFT_471590 [Jimgerdemannia flammicorona]
MLDKLYKSLKEYTALKIYQYELVTALYMLEPWEKALFNSIVITGVILSAYTACTYAPQYGRAIMRGEIL